MNKSKKYLVIINTHKSDGSEKNTYKLVLRGENEESLRGGISNFIKNEIESMSDATLRNQFGLHSSEVIEEEIKTAIDNWELYPPAEKLYKKKYLYEPEPGDPNPRTEFTQVKNIIKIPMSGYEYDTVVKEVTDDPRLSSCKEVIVMWTDTEDIFNLEYPEIIYVKDIDDEKDEEIVYENGHYETICKTSSESEEYLLGWNRDVLKVVECL